MWLSTVYNRPPQLFFPPYPPLPSTSLQLSWKRQPEMEQHPADIKSVEVWSWGWASCCRAVGWATRQDEMDKHKSESRATGRAQQKWVIEQLWSWGAFQYLHSGFIYTLMICVLQNQCPEILIRWTFIIIIKETDTAIRNGHMYYRGGTSCHTQLQHSPKHVFCIFYINNIPYKTDLCSHVPRLIY